MSLIATGLSVSFGERRIVDNVSLKVKSGEVVFLLGPNGAGKTTLMRALCGLVPHDGQVTWNESNIESLGTGQRAKTLAYLPQGHDAHWPLSARRVVAIGRLPHVSSLTRLREDDEHAIDRAMEQADVADFAGRDVTTLSGGERARVMLARALAVDAPVLLADEPVAALDAAHQIAMAELMVELAHGGRAILAVVHDLGLASRFADRILVIDNGRLTAQGTPAEVMTPELLANVFHIEARAIEADGKHAIMPWRTLRNGDD